MSQVEVKLASVQVTDGQGIGEGNFELRIEVKEGGKSVVWPAPNSSATVDNNGSVFPIGHSVGLYTINSETSKIFTVSVTEVDKGTLGADDYGSGTVSLQLSPTMAPVSHYATIDLKRAKMKANGQVKVTLSAARTQSATA